MKKRLLVLACISALAACKKDENKSANNGGNNGGSNTSFTPPTTNYWKLNGITNMESADIGDAIFRGTKFDLNKPFQSSSFYSVMQVLFNDSLDIETLVPEGGYKEFYLSRRNHLGGHAEDMGDSVTITITESRSGADGGTYGFYSRGGKIYVSKKSGKLRYTTDGSINMAGSKYPNVSVLDQTGTTEFSWIDER